MCVCDPGVTHPGGHSSGGKPSDVVLKVNPSDADHVHLVGRVVQGAARGKRPLDSCMELKD